VQSGSSWGVFSASAQHAWKGELRDRSDRKIIANRNNIATLFAFHDGLPSQFVFLFYIEKVALWSVSTDCKRLIRDNLRSIFTGCFASGPSCTVTKTTVSKGNLDLIDVIAVVEFLCDCPGAVEKPELNVFYSA